MLQPVIALEPTQTNRDGCGTNKKKIPIATTVTIQLEQTLNSVIFYHVGHLSALSTLQFKQGCYSMWKSGGDMSPQMRKKMFSTVVCIGKFIQCNGGIGMRSEINRE